MVVVAHRHPSPLHPLHAVLLAGTVPLFLGAMLTDLAYWQTYQIQWTNFASWLIVGALFFAGVVLLWAVIDLVRGARGPRSWFYFGLVLATWVLAFFNALVHARDGWAAMPAALVLSVIGLVVACAATWVGFSAVHRGDHTWT